MSLLRNASLTEAQQDQVHALMSDHRARMEPAFQQLHDLLDQVADKIEGSPDVVSLTDLAPLHAQVTQLQSQIDEWNLETAVKIRAVLTPAQRAHLADVHQQQKSLRKQFDALTHPSDGPPGRP